MTFLSEGMGPNCMDKETSRNTLGLVQTIKKNNGFIQDSHTFLFGKEPLGDEIKLSWMMKLSSLTSMTSQLIKGCPGMKLWCIAGRCFVRSWKLQNCRTLGRSSQGVPCDSNVYVKPSPCEHGLRVGGGIIPEIWYYSNIFQYIPIQFHLVTGWRSQSSISAPDLGVSAPPPFDAKHCLKDGGPSKHQNKKSILKR